MESTFLNILKTNFKGAKTSLNSTRVGLQCAKILLELFLNVQKNFQKNRDSMVILGFWG